MNKPEMTVEAKARFFALYWGQKIVCYPNIMGGHRNISQEHFNKYTFLELKPLSSITDQDAKELAKTGLPDQLYDYLWSSGTGKQIANSINHGRQTNTFYPNFRMGDAFDFLRSRGYALPFMGWSVKQMVEAGWIKLKGGSDGNV